MLLDALRTRQPSLSSSAQKVAQAVLQHPQRTLAENLSALARHAGVSEPTVVRFCRSLDCSGWHDFKLKLAQDLAVMAPPAPEDLLAEDLANDLTQQVCNRSINTLLDLRNHLDPAAVQAALEILSKARRIELYGHGSSGIVAVDAQHKFFRSGVPAVAYTDPHIHGISAALLNPGDVVVAISQRGETPALLRSLHLARAAGADTLVLAPSGTPAAALATVLIPVDMRTEPDPYTPISVRLAHLVVIDILAVGLALRQGPEQRRRLQTVQSTLHQMDLQLDLFLPEDS